MASWRRARGQGSILTYKGRVGRHRRAAEGSDRRGEGGERGGRGEMGGYTVSRLKYMSVSGYMVYSWKYMSSVSQWGYR